MQLFINSQKVTKAGEVKHRPFHTVYRKIILTGDGEIDYWQKEQELGRTSENRRELGMWY